MGVYNSVITLGRCDKCDHVNPIAVQFKDGEHIWLVVYLVGEYLKTQAGDIDVFSKKVEGISYYECELCDFKQYHDYSIIVESGKLMRLEKCSQEDVKLGFIRS